MYLAYSGPAELGEGARLLERYASGGDLDQAAAAHVVEDLRDRLAGRGDHRREILVRQPQLDGNLPIVPLAELLRQDRQQVGEPHLGLAGQEALHQLLVLHEPELQEGHELEGNPGFLAYGPLDEHLRNLRHPALRDGLRIGALSRLSGEGQMPEDVPRLE